MQFKSLWIKASAKCINVNGNLRFSDFLINKKQHLLKIEIRFNKYTTVQKFGVSRCFVSFFFFKEINTFIQQGCVQFEIVIYKRDSQDSLYLYFE